MPPTHLLLAAPGARVHRVRPGRADVRAGGHRWIIGATLLVAVAAALGYLRSWPPLATVMSGSMAPSINTGDIVVLKRLDAPAAVGDVVMVRVPDEARSRFGYPPVVIHRVTAIAADGTVTTKGDAKKEIDPFTVPQRTITTRVLTHIPAAGQVFSFLGSTLGLLWLAGGVALLVGMPLLDRYRDAQRRVTDERDERELVIEELLTQVELLPAQIERAVANAVAAATAAASGAVDTSGVAASSGAADMSGAADADGAAEPTGSTEPTDATAPDGASRLVAATVFSAPVVATAPSPARIIGAAEFAALALAGRTPAPAPPPPPVPPSRFPAAPPAPRPVVRSVRLVRACAARGVLCATGGPLTDRGPVASVRRDAPHADRRQPHRRDPRVAAGDRPARSLPADRVHAARP